MRRIFVLFITLAAGLMLPAATPAQTVEQPAVQQPAFQVRTAHLIEFNIPAKIDASPGAMVVDTRGEDNNRIWFVTRLGTQRVIRVNPAKSLMKGAAQFILDFLVPAPTNAPFPGRLVTAPSHSPGATFSRSVRSPGPLSASGSTHRPSIEPQISTAAWSRLRPRSPPGSPDGRSRCRGS